MKYRTIPLIVAAALLPVASTVGALAGEVQLVAHLSGVQEVPPVDSLASGALTMTLSEDRTMLTFSLTVNDLDTASITKAHIHVGAPGVNGPIIFVLSDMSFTSPLTGKLTADNLVPDPASGVNTFADAIAKIVDGNAYANVHTTAHPDGEIRGQIGRILAIKIRPAINPRNRGVIAVTILSTEDFNAQSVDATSVVFGNGAHEAHGRGHVEDVNGDGREDMVLHFRTRATGIVCGDTQAQLSGLVTSGLRFEATATFRTVGCHGNNGHQSNTTHGP